MKFPVTLYHPDSKNPEKRIHARDQAALAGLLKLGWKSVNDPLTIEGNHPLTIQGN
jgi:hypothetical protein